MKCLWIIKIRQGTEMVPWDFKAHPKKRRMRGTKSRRLSLQGVLWFRNNGSMEICQELFLRYIGFYLKKFRYFLKIIPYSLFYQF